MVLALGYFWFSVSFNILSLPFSKYTFESCNPLLPSNSNMLAKLFSKECYKGPGGVEMEIKTFMFSNIKEKQLGTMSD